MAITNPPTSRLQHLPPPSNGAPCASHDPLHRYVPASSATSSSSSSCCSTRPTVSRNPECVLGALPADVARYAGTFLDTKSLVHLQTATRSDYVSTSPVITPRVRFYQEILAKLPNPVHNEASERIPSAYETLSAKISAINFREAPNDRNWWTFLTLLSEGIRLNDLETFEPILMSSLDRHSLAYVYKGIESKIYREQRVLLEANKTYEAILNRLLSPAETNRSIRYTLVEDLMAFSNFNSKIATGLASNYYRIGDKKNCARIMAQHSYGVEYPQELKDDPEVKSLCHNQFFAHVDTSPCYCGILRTIQRRIHQLSIERQTQQQSFNIEGILRKADNGGYSGSNSLVIDEMAKFSEPILHEFEKILKEHKSYPVMMAEIWKTKARKDPKFNLSAKIDRYLEEGNYKLAERMALGTTELVVKVAVFYAKNNKFDRFYNILGERFAHIISDTSLSETRNFHQLLEVMSPEDISILIDRFACRENWQGIDYCIETLLKRVGDSERFHQLLKALKINGISALITRTVNAKNWARLRLYVRMLERVEASNIHDLTLKKLVEHLEKKHAEWQNKDDRKVLVHLALRCADRMTLKSAETFYNTAFKKLSHEENDSAKKS